MQPAIHLQIMVTHWTKQSRGAPGATLRARAPLAYAVAPNLLERGQLSVEIRTFSEGNFAQPFDTRARKLELSGGLCYKHGAFELSWDGENATTRWRGSDENVGAPEAKFWSGAAGQIEVAPDSWVRLRWHGRFSDSDTGVWHYQQTVINIARCDAELKADFAGEPSRLFEWLPPLR